jgi:DNA-binding winged helix-turn-helix (wHTH) protein/tetratricopeptide (TPR) repeat protein
VPQEEIRGGAGEWVGFGDFELHLGRGELRRAGGAVRLQPQATRLLVLLVARAGELVTHEQIRDHLWGATLVDFEQGVHNAVRQIRAALGESAEAPAWVETVPRRGYRFRGGGVRTAGSPAASARRAGRSAGWIAAALTAALVAGGAWLAGRRPPPAPRAPSADYLKASHLLAAGQPEAAERSIPLFEAAIRAEPRSAGAHAGLATAILRSPDPRPRLEQARAAIAAALEIEPRRAEALARRGEVALFYDWDAAAALAALDRAVAAGPDDALVLVTRAHARAALGDHPAAIADGERALALDPVSSTVRGDLGLLYFWARRYAEAAAAWQAVLELDPEQPAAQVGRLEALLAMGRAEEARPLALAVLRRERASEAELGRVAGAPAQEVETRYVAARLRLLAGRPAARPEALAYLHARLGDTAQALAWLAVAYEQRAPALVFLGVDPDVDRLRPLPEFHSLLAQVGVVRPPG